MLLVQRDENILPDGVGSQTADKRVVSRVVERPKEAMSYVKATFE
jgi:hypothetical protein